MRGVAFKSAEKYVKEYKQMENDLVRFRRQARNNGNFFLEPEAKLAFVIRIRGLIGIPPRPRRSCSCCACARSTTACSSS